MYIPPFLAGVITTIVSLIIVINISAIVSVAKSHDDKTHENSDKTARKD